MKISKSRTAALLGLLAGLCLVFNANAASTWAFGASGVNDVNGEPLAATSYAVGGTNLSISGAYATNGASDVAFATGATWNTGTASSPLYFSGGGLGMASDGFAAPNHAIDNVGNTEAILLSFSSQVVLSSIGIGFKSGDADVSLFRFVGTSSTGPSMAGVGASLTTMTAAGWQLVGNYGDLAVDTVNDPYNVVNTGSKGSSWWLISAYNSSYGAATTGTVNQGNDYFKLFAVAADKCTTGTGGNSSDCGGKRVPEPGSLALASLAIFGVIYTRRQRKTEAQS